MTRSIYKSTIVCFILLTPLSNLFAFEDSNVEKITKAISGCLGVSEIQVKKKPQINRLPLYSVQFSDLENTFVCGAYLNTYGAVRVEGCRKTNLFYMLNGGFTYTFNMQLQECSSF